jgi:uncharacterized protein
MRKILIALSLILSFAASAKDLNVVLEMTSDDPKNWAILLNNLEGVSKNLPKNGKIELVLHGGGVGLVLKKNNYEMNKLKTFSEERVSIVVCENTMRRKKITKSELYEFVETVPAGIVEIVKKQSEGWAYVKIGD